MSGEMANDLPSGIRDYLAMPIGQRLRKLAENCADRIFDGIEYNRDALMEAAAAIIVADSLEAAILSPISAQPVAWRYRWIELGKYSQWMFSEEPAEPRPETPTLNGVEVEALYVGADARMTALEEEEGMERIKRRILALRQIMGMPALQAKCFDRDGEWTASGLFNEIDIALLPSSDRGKR